MKEFVIIDLEWTSWKENYNKRKDTFNRRKVWQKKEIIQIGAIRFNKYYKILDTLPYLKIWIRIVIFIC